MTTSPLLGYFASGTLKLDLRTIFPGQDHDVISAIRAQNTVNPAGQLGASPAPAPQETTFTVRTEGRLETTEDFGRIVVRANPDGTVVRLRDVARVELGGLSYRQIGRPS